MRMRTKLAGLLLAISASPAWAVSAFDLNKLTSAQAGYDALASDLVSALSYKAVSPAEPLGLTGFDIGLELSLTELPGIKTWGQVIGTTSLGSLPMPKLHLHKGLPFGIDLGAVYTSIPGANIGYYGGELRYSFVSGNVALPAVSVRGTMTKLTGVKEMDLSTTGIELSVSKGFLMLTPYVGVGQVWGSADPKGLTLGPITLKKSEPSMSKTFAGLNFNMGLMNFAFEWDKTGDANTYSGKLGFRF